MKRRKGFVSNSSSSSYIIAIKDLFKPCPTCSEKGDDFLNKIEGQRRYNDDNQVNGVGADHILWEFHNNEWNEPDKELIEKVKSYKGNEEWTLASIEISRHCDELRKELDKLVEKGTIKIINESNG